jgi:hypothetical protein
LNLLNYYPELSEKYPKYVTQQQLCAICGISKTTAYLLEQDGAIPYSKCVDRLLHTHSIKLEDALALKYTREHGYRKDPAYAIAMTTYYEKQLAKYPDTLSVIDIVNITGYTKQSVQRWIQRKYIRYSFLKGRRYYIPKKTLIEFLVGPVYNGIQDKSETQIQQLRAFSEKYIAERGDQ